MSQTLSYEEQDQILKTDPLRPVWVLRTGCDHPLNPDMRCVGWFPTEEAATTEGKCAVQEDRATKWEIESRPLVDLVLGLEAWLNDPPKGAIAKARARILAAAGIKV